MEQDISWDDVNRAIASEDVAVIPDTGIYLSTSAFKVSQALAAQLKNLHSCPKDILIVTIVQGDIPLSTLLCPLKKKQNVPTT